MSDALRKEAVKASGIAAMKRGLKRNKSRDSNVPSVPGSPQVPGTPTNAAESPAPSERSRPPPSEYSTPRGERQKLRGKSFKSPASRAETLPPLSGADTASNAGTNNTGELSSMAPPAPAPSPASLKSPGSDSPGTVLVTPEMMRHIMGGEELSRVYQLLNITEYIISELERPDIAKKMKSVRGSNDLKNMLEVLYDRVYANQTRIDAVDDEGEVARTADILAQTLQEVVAVIERLKSKSQTRIMLSRKIGRDVRSLEKQLGQEINMFITSVSLALAEVTLSSNSGDDGPDRPATPGDEPTGQDDVEAALHAGNRHRTRSEFNMAEERYLYAAHHGNAEAMLALSELYEAKLVEPKDPSQGAEHYLEAAAAANYAPAMVRLALTLLKAAARTEEAVLHMLEDEKAQREGVDERAVGRAIDLLQRAIMAGVVLPPGLDPQEVGRMLHAEKGRRGRPLRAAVGVELDYQPSSLDAMAYLGDLRLVQGDHVSAVQLWSEAATRGSAIAAYFLGAHLREVANGHRQYAEAVYGIDREDNLNEAASCDANAARWLQKAAAQGHAGACNVLGQCYEEGRGVPRDVGRAMVEYKRAADRGFASGCYNLGFLKCRAAIDSASVVKQGEEAKGPAAAGADTLHLSDTAHLLRAAKDRVNEGVEYLKTASDLGVMEAGYQLGQLYASGLGLGLLAKNDELALEFYLEAAELGHAVSLVKAADRIFSGVGQLPDPHRASELYFRAAQAGDAEAMNNLGIMHEEGNGVAQSLETARMWYEEATRAGSAEAPRNLRFLLERQCTGAAEVPEDVLRGEGAASTLPPSGNEAGQARKDAAVLTAVRKAFEMADAQGIGYETPATASPAVEGRATAVTERRRHDRPAANSRWDFDEGSGGVAVAGSRPEANVTQALERMSTQPEEEEVGRGSLHVGFVDDAEAKFAAGEDLQGGAVEEKRGAPAVGASAEEGPGAGHQDLYIDPATMPGVTSEPAKSPDRRSERADKPARRKKPEERLPSTQEEGAERASRSSKKREAPKPKPKPEEDVEGEVVNPREKPAPAPRRDQTPNASAPAPKAEAPESRTMTRTQEESKASSQLNRLPTDETIESHKSDASASDFEDNNDGSYSAATAFRERVAKMKKPPQALPDSPASSTASPSASLQDPPKRVSAGRAGPSPHTQQSYTPTSESLADQVASVARKRSMSKSPSPTVRNLNVSGGFGEGAVFTGHSTDPLSPSGNSLHPVDTEVEADRISGRLILTSERADNPGSDPDPRDKPSPKHTRGNSADEPSQLPGPNRSSRSQSPDRDGYAPHTRAEADAVRESFERAAASAGAASPPRKPKPTPETGEARVPKAVLSPRSPGLEQDY
mmetsp:Transcript_25080/g.78663  ORF Transcript_25080/g.78663 Transcript_25080/m.78663 type:complete len:1355 (-) Transcript_25080:128-4192(-)